MTYEATVRFEFKLEDFWIGAFWKRRSFVDGSRGGRYECLDIWICFVPCVPLHITLASRPNKGE